MAHILIGWELGAGRGHALRIAQLAKALRAAGHRLSFAVQRVDALDPEAGGEVWQAPVTPR
jgi:rhamnosyltransferase subunit B